MQTSLPSQVISGEYYWPNTLAWSVARVLKEKLIISLSYSSPQHHSSCRVVLYLYVRAQYLSLWKEVWGGNRQNVVNCVATIQNSDARLSCSNKFYFSIRKYTEPTKHTSIKNKTDIKKTEIPSWRQVWSRFVKCCIIMKTYFRCVLHRKCKCHCSSIGNKNNI